MRPMGDTYIYIKYMVSGYCIVPAYVDLSPRQQKALSQTAR